MRTTHKRPDIVTGYAALAMAIVFVTGLAAWLAMPFVITYWLLS